MTIGHVVLTIYMPSYNFHTPTIICKNPVMLMYTARKISMCVAWKINCPVSHKNTHGFKLGDNIYMPWACGRALTHWGRDEMNNISQTTFSNIFSSMKMFEFRLKFHWSLFPRIQLTILVYRCIYASLGLNKLMLSPDWVISHSDHGSLPNQRQVISCTNAL